MRWRKLGAQVKLTDPIPGRQVNEPLLVLGEPIHWFLEVHPGQNAITAAKSPFNNSGKIRWSKSSDSGLGPTGDIPLVIQEPTFDNRIGITERYWITEVEVCALLYDGEVHVFMPRVRNDLLHLGNCEIAFGVLHLGWFEVDDPIAFTFLGT